METYGQVRRERTDAPTDLLLDSVIKQCRFTRTDGARQQAKVGERVVKSAIYVFNTNSIKREAPPGDEGSLLLLRFGFRDRFLARWCARSLVCQVLWQRSQRFPGYLEINFRFLHVPPRMALAVQP